MNNELEELLKDCIKKNINILCHELINKYPIMLFMKGTVNQPRCGFSKQMIEILGDDVTNKE